MDCSIISSHQHEWQQRTSINDQNNQVSECVTSGKMNQNWCSVIDQDLMTKCRITGIFLLFKIAAKKTSNICTIHQRVRVQYQSLKTVVSLHHALYGFCTPIY